MVQKNISLISYKNVYILIKISVCLIYTLCLKILFRCWNDRKFVVVRLFLIFCFSFPPCLIPVSYPRHLFFFYVFFFPFSDALSRLFFTIFFFYLLFALKVLEKLSVEKTERCTSASEHVKKLFKHQLDQSCSSDPPHWGTVIENTPSRYRENTNSRDCTSPENFFTTFFVISLCPYFLYFFGV